MTSDAPCYRVLHETIAGFEDEFRLVRTSIEGSIKINYTVKAWICGEREDESSNARVALYIRCQHALGLEW